MSMVEVMVVLVVLLLVGSVFACCVIDGGISCV